MEHPQDHNPEHREHAPSPCLEARHAELHNPNEKNIHEALSHHVDHKHEHPE